jgi:hypothetical protein
MCLTANSICEWAGSNVQVFMVSFHMRLQGGGVGGPWRGLKGPPGLCVVQPFERLSQLRGNLNAPDLAGDRGSRGPGAFNEF